MLNVGDSIEFDGRQLKVTGISNPLNFGLRGDPDTHYTCIDVNNRLVTVTSSQLKAAADAKAQASRHPMADAPRPEPMIAPKEEPIPEPVEQVPLSPSDPMKDPDEE